MIHTKDDIKTIVIKLEEKCKELALSNIRSNITVKGNSNKHRTYAKVNNSIVIEDYLIYNLSCSHKRALAKIRLSDHKLRIETGRHHNLPYHLNKKHVRIKLKMKFISL